MKQFIWICSVLMSLLLYQNNASAQSFYTYVSDDGEHYFEGWVGCDTVIKYVTVQDVVTPDLQVTVYWGDGSSEDLTLEYDEDFALASRDHYYPIPGFYTALYELKSADGTLLDTHTEDYTVVCTSVWGYVYQQVSADCSLDTDTDLFGYSAKEVELSKDGVPVDTFLVYSGYHYSIDIAEPDYTAEYAIRLLDNGLGLTQVCDPITFEILDLTSSTHHMDIPYECSDESAFDNSVYMYGFYRTVDTSYIGIAASHSSCAGMGDATVTLDISPKYIFAYATVPPTSVSGNTLTWDLEDFNYTSFFVFMIPSTVLTAGDTAESYVSIVPTSADINIENNYDTLNLELSASMDPNNKVANPGKHFESGQEITYTINFENLGTDTAFNIHILDTLSSNVLPNTLKVLSSSHVMHTHQVTSGSDHIVKFDFPNIKLPTSDYPDQNKGYVTYSIQTVGGLPLGSEVRNTAHIYFDVNPAIVTNTTINTIPNPASIEHLPEEFSALISPNPTTGSVQVQLKDATFRQIKLVNTLGQVLQLFEVKEGKNMIDLSHQNAGIYYLLFQAQDKMYTYKIVKL